MNKIRLKKGFTLIELLIASTIFALIMVIVVGIFAWAAGYNSRLRETRRIANNSRIILTDLSNQIRLSNGSVKFATHVVGAVVLLNCNGATCSIVGGDTPVRYKADPDNVIQPEPDVFVANTLLILKKDQNKAICYQTAPTAGSNYKFIKREIDFADWDGVLNLLSFDLANASALNEVTTSMKIYFGGYGPARANLTLLNSDKKQQPYVEFYLIGKSYDYDILRPVQRAQFQAKTTIESRDYN